MSKHIYHVVRDRNDPSWDDWSVYRDEKFYCSAWRLREIRHQYDTSLKRGICPHFEGEICGWTADEADDLRKFNWSIYWFETKDDAED